MREYGASTGVWRSVAGVRELIQNLYDGILEAKELESHSQLRVEEFSNGERAPSCAKHPESHPPATHVQSFLYDVDDTTHRPLGHVAWKPNKEDPSLADLELFNAGTVSWGSWAFGGSTKGDDPKFIGEHGDGAKMGALFPMLL